MAVSGELGGEGDCVSGCKNSLCNLKLQAFFDKFLYKALKNSVSS